MDPYKYSIQRRKHWNSTEKRTKLSHSPQLKMLLLKTIGKYGILSLTFKINFLAAVLLPRFQIMTYFLFLSFQHRFKCFVPEDLCQASLNDIFAYLVQQHVQKGIISKDIKGCWKKSMLHVKWWDFQIKIQITKKTICNFIKSVGCFPV